MIETPIVLALGILLSSFLGSWHCAAMCSPLAGLMDARQGLWSYHCGRLFSYAAFGAAAGAMGNFFLTNEFVAVRYITAILLSITLCYAGLRLLYPDKFKNIISASIANMLLPILKRARILNLSKSSFTIGIFTVFLPCGWLYTYITASLTTQSPYAGALVMTLFWLGGLPALAAMPWLTRRITRNTGQQQKRIAGYILVGTSLYSICSFLIFARM